MSEALAAEARYVDRATQREAVERLTALLARHVAPGKEILRKCIGNN